MQAGIAFKFSKINKCWWLLGIVLIVNVLQAIFTPLLNDEPYYWLYAQYPSWGYFDHPPMVAFFIHIGDVLFNGELGVRFIHLIFGSLTFVFLYKIIEGETERPVNFKLISLLLLSSLFLNLYSFLALPDTPMLFFAVLFLYCYRKYLTTDNFLNTAILGLVTALLLYSKYHGILIIGFTVLSNIGLFTKKSFYGVSITAIILFIPHILWQAQHDFPTIRFQFSERATGLTPRYVFNYLGEQAAVTGPVILLLFSILYAPKNQFQKSLKYNVIGIFAFFLASSVKEMVNVHWTAIAFPPMLCLAYLYIDTLKSNTKIVYGLLLFNLLIVMALRINFVANVFQIANFNDKNPALMTSLLKEKLKGYPLVFKDMYIEPADFMFYGHTSSYAVNDIWYKKTQFNFLPALAQKFQGKSVELISADSLNAASTKIKVNHKTYYATRVQNFSSYNTIVKISASTFNNLRAAAYTVIRLCITNTLTEKDKVQFKLNKAHLLVTFINKQNNKSFSYKYNGELNLSQQTAFNFPFKTPAEKGKYRCIFSIVTDGSYCVGFNSNIYSCSIL